MFHLPKVKKTRTTHDFFYRVPKLVNYFHANTNLDLFKNTASFKYTAAAEFNKLFLLNICNLDQPYMYFLISHLHCLHSNSSLSLSLSLSPSLFIYLYIFLSIYRTIHLPIYLYNYLSIYLFIYLSIYPSTHLSIYMSIYLLNYLSANRSISIFPSTSTYISTYKSIHLFICLSI